MKCGGESPIVSEFKNKKKKWILFLIY
jgi:hypothetical protein